MHVYPKPGVLTRDPVKKDLLPEDGREVSHHDPFWARRIADGDVLTTKPNAAKPSTKKPNGSESE
jgi:hypothetical protein